MPRKARIDAPGALHHIIVRGIERKAIFRDALDSKHFLDRLGGIFSESGTGCYAWVLMENHAHLLLRTGLVPLATVMRRLLTGYALGFNRRRKRHGQVFQNRYKSFLCEEDPYLKELVRYIHLNPLRSRVVADLKELRSYPYCGHGVLMGKVRAEWQDAEYVLGFFGSTVGVARRAYLAFVAKGIEQGRRPDLVGGGLIRSVGGWAALEDYRKGGRRIKGDERILGSSDFVERVLEAAEENFEERMLIRPRGPNLNDLIKMVAEHFHIDSEDIMTTSKERKISGARAVLCYLGTRKLMISCADIARELNISPSTVSRASGRGRNLPESREIDRKLFEA
jgi:REP element-mobilizing transposase RayT